MSSLIVFPAQRRRARLCCAMLALTATLAIPVFGATSELSLTQAQQLALQRSRQLASSDHAADAARQLAIACNQLPDPVLKAGIENLPVSGADRFSLGNDFMTMRSVGVSQELTAASKR